MNTAMQNLPNSAQPATPIQSSHTTAVVREHACLFTHDLRRKQKRWKDGRLKYHTFNKRLMVYDDRGNFVGDTHWQEDSDLADGDEIELERGGIVVQVGECVDRHDQDLSDLIDKRTQERAQRQAASAVRRSINHHPATPHAVRPQVLPQKHIHDVIGTPSGHYGRAALPKESPYEERRQRETLQGEGSRPAKRQRRDVSQSSKTGYAQSLFGATLTLSGRPSSQAPVRRNLQRPTHTCTEMITLPSSGTSDYDVRPTEKVMQNHSSLENMPGNSLIQTSVHVTGTLLSTPALIRSRSSTHPVIRRHGNQDVLDDPQKSPIPQFQEPKPRDDQEHIIENRRSVSDTRGKPGGLSQRAGPRTGSSGKPSVTKISIEKSRDKKSLDTPNNWSRAGRKDDLTLIDGREHHAQGPFKEAIGEEPRTELRIKPRRKRGLLMVTEQDTMTTKNRDLLSPAKAQFNDIVTKQRSEKINSTSNNGHSRARLPKEATSGDNGNDDHDPVGEDEFDDMYFLNNSGPETRQTVKPRAPIKQPTEKHTENTAKAGKASRLERLLSGELDSSLSDANGGQAHLTSAEMPNSDAADGLPPPRLANLGHRGIRSREVIGIVFDEPDPFVSIKPKVNVQEDSVLDLPPDQTSKGHQHEEVEVVNDGPVAVEASPDDGLQSRGGAFPETKASTVPPRQNPGNSSVVLNTERRTTSSPRTATSPTKRAVLTNPATRGKKAAKPSDAAGQMPICPLPMEPIGRPSLRPALSTEKAMPGFSRANGGPWSREAQDLFDYRRPP